MIVLSVGTWLNKPGLLLCFTDSSLVRGAGYIEMMVLRLYCAEFWDLHSSGIVGYAVSS